MQLSIPMDNGRSLSLMVEADVSAIARKLSLGPPKCTLPGILPALATSCWAMVAHSNAPLPVFARLGSDMQPIQEILPRMTSFTPLLMDSFGLFSLKPAISHHHHRFLTQHAACQNMARCVRKAPSGILPSLSPSRWFFTLPALVGFSIGACAKARGKSSSPPTLPVGLPS